jgi:hypothetical protein
MFPTPSSHNSSNDGVNSSSSSQGAGSSDETKPVIHHPQPVDPEVQPAAQAPPPPSLRDSEGKRKRESLEGEEVFTLKRAKFDTPEELDLEKDSGGEEEMVPKSATPEKKLNELLDPIYRLRTQLESVLGKLPKPSARSSQLTGGDVWGKLYPQFQGQSPISLSGIVFTIGRSPRCNLVIKDPVVNGVLCRLHFVQGKAFIESMSSSGILSLNHRTVRKQVKLHLRDGDEISITGNQTYSYIFNQIKTASTGSDIDIMETISPPKPIKLNSFSRPSYRPLIMNDTKSIEKLTSTLNISPSVPMFMDAMNDPHLSENTDLSSHAIQIPLLDMSDLEKSADKSDTEITPTEKGAEFKAQLMQKIESLFIYPDDISVTFDQFPYYLSENVKEMLINAAFIYLEKPQFTKYAKSIPSLSRRILLSGQKGTQFLQEKLVQALAKHFRAKLLILDDCFQENPKSDCEVSPATLSMLDEVNLGVTFETTVPSRCTFKKGDKVRFVGNTSNSLNSSGVNCLFVPTREDSTKKLSFSSSSIASSSRPNTTRPTGPSVGYTGKVMLTFDDNPRKVGVRFDKPVPGGINLGNLCEDNHGFFIDASELKHEMDPVPDESADCLTIEVLFETLNKEENQPCIVFVRSFEKTIMVNYERYLNLKKELEKLESRTIFIALTINTTGKDKSERPGFLLSSKSGGGSHTALLDVSFLDHLSRMDDRKETTKTTKIISKMFPCKINTHPPVNQNQLTEWQKQIAQDRQKNEDRHKRY